MKTQFFIVVGGSTYTFRRAKDAEWAAEQCFLLSGWRPEVNVERVPA